MNIYAYIFLDIYRVGLLNKTKNDKKQNKAYKQKLKNKTYTKKVLQKQMLQKFYSFYHVVFFYQFRIFENKNTRKCLSMA